MKMDRYYIYRFLNKKRDVIYVGRTKNISSRISKQHFAENGHLDPKCYDETLEVHYAELNNINEQMIYELYFIGKFKPKYNSQYNTGNNDLDFTLPDVNWNIYIEPKKSKIEYMEVIYKMDIEIQRVHFRAMSCIEDILEKDLDRATLIRKVESIKCELDYLLDYRNNNDTLRTYTDKIKLFKTS
jgi:predicted GIY-YIG superfamily endonuclease